MVMLFDELWLFYKEVFGEPYCALCMILCGVFSLIAILSKIYSSNNPKNLFLFLALPFIIITSPILLFPVSLVAFILFLNSFRKDN
jgi:hypothetical protein